VNHSSSDYVLHTHCYLTMKWTNYESRVLVDDAPLEEYQQKLEGNNMSCYIASEAGKVRGYHFYTNCYMLIPYFSTSVLCSKRAMMSMNSTLPVIIGWMDSV
jgi:hypothetical protein